MSAIFLRQLWKQKPRQWGPSHAVRAAVVENCGRLGLPCPTAFMPCWSHPVQDVFGEQTPSYTPSGVKNTVDGTGLYFNNDGFSWNALAGKLGTTGTMLVSFHLPSEIATETFFLCAKSGSRFYLSMYGGKICARLGGGSYAGNITPAYGSTAPAYTATFSWNNETTVNNGKLYVDGDFSSNVSSGGSLAAPTDFAFAEYIDGRFFIKATFLTVGLWNVEFTDDNHVAAGTNPYQLFQPIQRVYYSIPDSAGPVNYTLLAALGSFDLSGKIAGLLFNRKLESNAGQYDLTGSGVGLLKNSVVSAENGTISISGKPAIFLLDRVLASMPGGYSLTGSDATLFYASESALLADAGSFVITGSDANLTKNSVLFAANGEHTIGGSAAALLIDRILSANNGDYNITGSTVNLLCNRKIDAGSGEYSLAGSDADLSYASGLGIFADAGSFTITGTGAGLQYNRKMSVEPGSITMSGKAAALLFSRVLESETGTFSITGSDADFLRDFVLSADSGEFELTGQSVTLFYSGIVLPSGEVSVTFTVKKPAMLFSAKKPTITFN